MSGRIVRQFREARARQLALPKCQCGYGIYEEDGQMVFRCHDMDCAFLKGLGELRRKGFCAQCGYRLRRIVSGRWTQSWCKFGHEHSMVMR